MFARLRLALDSIISLPNYLEALRYATFQLQQQQHETNSLLRELIVAITTQPPETPHQEPPSPIGLGAAPIPDPQPMPSPRLPRRAKPYTAEDVHLQTPASAANELARRAAHDERQGRVPQRIVPPPG